MPNEAFDIALSISNYFHDHDYTVVGDMLNAMKIMLMSAIELDNPAYTINCAKKLQSILKFSTTGTTTLDNV